MGGEWAPAFLVQSICLQAALMISDWKSRGQEEELGRAGSHETDDQEEDKEHLMTAPVAGLYPQLRVGIHQARVNEPTPVHS